MPITTFVRSTSKRGRGATDHESLRRKSAKAILGRWLSEEMKVILLDEPTRGIDVGAKHEIYNVIYALAAQGVAVLFASSDLPEVPALPTGLW